MGRFAMQVAQNQYPVTVKETGEQITVIKDMINEWIEPYSSQPYTTDKLTFVENEIGEREWYNDNELRMIANPAVEEGYSWAYGSKIEKDKWRDSKTGALYSRVITLDDSKYEMDDSERHEAILDEVKDLLYKKNADYNGAFDKSMDKFGPVCAAIRMGDKLSRFESLIKNDAQVKDESITDTLKDMIGYATLTVAWFQKHNKQE